MADLKSTGRLRQHSTACRQMSRAACVVNSTSWFNMKACSKNALTIFRPSSSKSRERPAKGAEGER
jgi:hypothetical protein